MHRGSKSDEGVPNPRLEVGERGIESVDLGQMQLEHEPMVGCDPAVERRDEVGPGRFEASRRAVCQAVGIGFSGDEGLENRAPTRAPDVADHFGQLDVRVFEGLLDALRVSSGLTNQLRPRSGEVAQVPHRSGGTKLLRISPNASQSAIHVASFWSRFRPGRVRMCIALASTRVRRPSRTCHTGLQ
jgi:hypothetical protein